MRGAVQPGGNTIRRGIDDDIRARTRLEAGSLCSRRVIIIIRILRPPSPYPRCLLSLIVRTEIDSVSRSCRRPVSLSGAAAADIIITLTTNHHDDDCSK